MTRKLRVIPEAEAELVAAAEWYESKRAGLGIELLTEVDQAIAALPEAPLLHPVWREGLPYRKLVLSRFPFVVFYTASDDEVEVVAIAHAKRRPGYWIGRG